MSTLNATINEELNGFILLTLNSTPGVFFVWIRPIIIDSYKAVVLHVWVTHMEKYRVHII